MTIRAELDRLLRLAGPVILGQVGLVTMGTVDLMMVGPLGPEALAAVGMGNLWSFGVLIVGFGALRGIDPVFSQAHGAGDRRALAAALGRSLLLALLFGVPIDLLHRVAGPALTLLQQPADAIALAEVYVEAIRWGIVPYLLFNVLSLFLQNLGRTLLPTLVILAANVANIALNALLIGWLGWGVAGCGWATVGCRVFSLLALAAAVWPLLRAYPRPPLRALLSVRPLLRLAAVGLPVGLQYGVEVWAFNAVGIMVGWLGTTAFAAHQVVLNISSVAFMVPFGLGIAASVRVGNLLGAGAPWARTGWLAVALSAVWMVVVAGLLLLAAPWLIGLFTQEPEVVAVAASLLPIMAAFQLFDGVQAVSAGVLRGAGDTRAPAIVNLVGFWLIGLPIGYALGVANQEAGGVWWGLVAGLGVVSVLLLARLRYVARVGGYRRTAD